MKKIIYVCSVIAFINGPLLSFGFDDFMAGGFKDIDFDNDFGNDFDDIDFESGNGSFNALFGKSDAIDDDYLNSASSTRRDSKKEVIMPPPASLEEGFKTGVASEVKKLHPDYKKAIKKYFDPLSRSLLALITHGSSFALGIKLKNDLKKSIEEASNVLQLVDKINTNSLYYIPLLLKEFSALREKIMKAPDAIAQVNTQFAALALQSSDSLDAPTESQKKAQKKVFKEAETVAAKTITPLLADLKKVIAHKRVDEKLKERKKKYADRVAGSRASATGGWSSGAGKYFDDGGYDSYGYGSGGWGEESNFWGGSNDFGGGWGSGSDWGSGGNWGHGNYEHDSWSSASNSVSRSSGSNNATSGSYRRIASSNDLYDLNFDDDADDGHRDSSAKNEKKQAYFSPEETGFEHLTLDKQAVYLIKKIDINLANWYALYVKATTPGAKKSALKTMLEQKSFTADVEQLNRLFDVFSDMTASDKSAAFIKEKEAFTKRLSTYIPMLIDAATYAAPPFALFFEEQATKEHKQKARETAERNEKQRALSYKRLLYFLAALRSNPGDQLFNVVVDQLLSHAREVLHKLEYFCKASEQIITPNESLLLTTLTRQLYHEPIIVGYATLAAQDDESPERVKKLAAIRSLKESVETALIPYIQRQYEHLDGMTKAATFATENIQAAFAIPSPQAIDFTQVAVLQTFAGQATAYLDEHCKELVYYNEMKKILIPYNKQQLQDIEVSRGLLNEIMRHWSLATTEILDEDEDDLTSELPDYSENTTPDELLPSKTSASTADTLFPELDAQKQTDRSYQDQLIESIETQ